MLQGVDGEKVSVPVRETVTDEDLAYGQPVARSNWVANAIRAQADATRVRAGGELPPAPAKLPTRSRVPMNRTN